VHVPDKTIRGAGVVGPGILSRHGGRLNACKIADAAFHIATLPPYLNINRL